MTRSLSALINFQPVVVLPPWHKEQSSQYRIGHQYSSPEDPALPVPSPVFGVKSILPTSGNKNVTEWNYKPLQRTLQSTFRLHIKPVVVKK